MKIDSATSPTIPPGLQRLVVISARTLAARKWSAAVLSVPHGTARTRSLYSHRHAVVLSADAIRIGIPAVAHGYATVTPLSATQTEK